MSKVLIDTNILVYAIDRDSAFFQKARHLLQESGFSLVTTSKNLVEFLAVVTKPTGYGLSNEVALDILADIIQGIEILYPTQESIAIFLELVNRYQPKGPRVHDIEIISIGLANNVFEVATFNTADFKSVREISLVDI